MRAELRAGLLWARLVAALLLGACAPTEAKAPQAMRPLDEGRAIQIIRAAIVAEGEHPAPGRDLELVNGTKIHVDVGVEGHAYGVVYVSLADAQRLGSNIQPPNKPEESLRLVRAGDGGEARLVLLYQQSYLYDDLAGEAHEQTTITCERQLTRDVRDFIDHARKSTFK